MVPGNIVETIFIDGFGSLSRENWERLEDYITDFCIDMKGRVRRCHGIIDMSGSDNLDMVPRSRYNITFSAWNSHQEYVEIEPPNPVDNPTYFKFIRDAWLAELNKRLQVDLRRKDLQPSS